MPGNYSIHMDDSRRYPNLRAIGIRAALCGRSNVKMTYDPSLVTCGPCKNRMGKGKRKEK